MADKTKFIRIDTWSGAYMVLDPEHFFPCSRSKLTALYRQILREDKRKPEVLKSILDWMMQRRYLLKLEFSRFDNPDLEASKSTYYKRLCANIKQIRSYLDET